MLQSNLTAMILLFFLFLSAPTIAEAKVASKDAFRAKKLIQSSQIVALSADESALFEVGFKNVGVKAWLSGSVILRSTVTRESYFYDSATWLSRVKAVLAGEQVEPGALAYFQVTLRAPVKAGRYREEMYLERDGAEIPGSRFAIPITVRPRLDALAATIEAPPQRIARGPILAQKLIQSDTALTMPTQGRIAFEIGYKNTGAAAWPVSGDTALALRSASKKESWFYDPSWQSGNAVTTIGGGNAGELVYVNFALNAPQIPGKYIEKLALYSGGKKLEGTDVAIPITVTAALPRATLASAPNLSQSAPPLPSVLLPTSTQAISGIVDDIRDSEKQIRVGITSSNDPIQLTASTDYAVRDTGGRVLGAQISGSVTTVIYDRATKLYSVTLQNKNATSTLPIRLEGGENAIFEILSYSNRPTWSTRINDNTFRGAMEVNYASATDRIWVINELPLEQYLKGTGETSNSSPYEFQKALMIAARTYALYHLQRSTKNAADHFTVRATDADQVYRGYAAETRLPNVARAITETRGVIVLHQGQLAITPYYSQSDGRTRAWGEVWGGGPYPWLKSVPDPGCAGLVMLGHGVGMSARGALLMALEGKNFEQILKYYYTGIELRRVY